MSTAMGQLTFETSSLSQQHLQHRKDGNLYVENRYINLLNPVGVKSVKETEAHENEKRFFFTDSSILRISPQYNNEFCTRVTGVLTGRCDSTPWEWRNT
jgi:hypothetical protein